MLVDLMAMGEVEECGDRQGGDLIFLIMITVVKWHLAVLVDALLG